jgi:hypothetical protein
LSEQALKDNPDLIKSFFPEEGVRFYFDDGSHLTIRPSGTENKLRFYVQWKTSGIDRENATSEILKSDILVYQIAMDSQKQVAVDMAQFTNVNDANPFGGIDLTNQLAIEEHGELEDDFWAVDSIVSDGAVPVIRPVILQMVPARERLLF